MTQVARRRLDQVLVARGLAHSRRHAVELITAGLVAVNRGPARSPARLVADGDEVVVLASTWRPRGARKLAGALDVFGVECTGRVCLDVGASTGGFTMALLERGARKVLCVDVGRGQLDQSLRADPRVVALEGVDVRDLRWPLEEPVELIVVDVSFISLRAVAPALIALAPAGAELVALIKPQFEVGRVVASRYHGVIPDGPERDGAIEAVLERCRSLGMALVARTASVVRGAQGNREEFAYLRIPPRAERAL